MRDRARALLATPPCAGSFAVRAALVPYGRSRETVSRARSESKPAVSLLKTGDDQRYKSGSTSERKPRCAQRRAPRARVGNERGPRARDPRSRFETSRARALRALRALLCSADSESGEKRLIKFADEEEHGKLEDQVVFSDKLHYSPTSMANEDLGHGGGATKATCCVIQ